MSGLPLRIFDFYLNCVRYCRANSISLSNIQKKNFREWVIRGVYERTE